MRYLYQYATIAYVGGGFGKKIHNILEPATFGMPIIFGRVSIFCSVKGWFMKKKDSKKELFRTLRIKESDYPPYVNPEQFGFSIKKCSLLKPHEIRYSDTTATQEVENK